MTTATQKSYAPIRGKIVRLTKLDNCGVPVVGATSQWVSKGFIHVNLKMAWSKANDVAVTTADNIVMVNEPGVPSLQSIAADVQLTHVNPDVIALLTGFQTQLDGAGNSVGYRLTSGQLLNQAFALEVWSDVAGAACDASGNRPYGYTLLPYLKGAQIADWNVDSGAATVGFNATTHEGSGWGGGPYKVVDTAVSGPATPGALLVPIGVKDQLHMQLTTIAPPAETAGLAAIVAGTGTN